MFDNLVKVHVSLYKQLNDLYLADRDTRVERMEVMDAIMVIDGLLWDKFDTVIVDGKSITKA